LASSQADLIKFSKGTKVRQSLTFVPFENFIPCNGLDVHCREKYMNI